MPERLDGIEAGGAAGGHEAEDDADGGGEDEGDDVDLGIEQEGRADDLRERDAQTVGKGDSRRAADAGERHRLDQELEQHFPRPRTDGETDAATWEALEESLVLTPSSFGLQPWKFLVIQDPGIRALLSPESWKQPQVTEASHYVVLTARTDLDSTDIDTWMARMAEVQGGSVETTAPLRGMIQGFAQAMSHEARHAWNIRQTYIALGQLMASAALLGIDACPMEGISAAGYDHVLGLEGSGYATVVACALGYRAADDKYAGIPKARFDRARVISHI